MGQQNIRVISDNKLVFGQKCGTNIPTHNFVNKGNDPLMRQLYEIDVASEVLPRHVPPTHSLLWRYRVQVTIEHLKNTFQEEVASGNPTNFPLLATFISQVRIKGWALFLVAGFSSGSNRRDFDLNTFSKFGTFL